MTTTNRTPRSASPSRPASAKSQSTKSRVSKPQNAQGSSAKPQSAKPQSAKSQSAKPQSAKPQSAKPQSAKPQNKAPSASASPGPTKALGDVKGKVQGAMKKVSRGQLAAAAGVATAATAAAVAGVVVRKRMASRNASEIAVEPNGDRWQVMVSGNEQPTKTFDLKRDAIDAGRELARKRAPSVLSIHRADGSEQMRHEYSA